MADVVAEGSHVNLTMKPVICAVATAHPLPAQAWAIVSDLAYAVEKASDRLNLLLGDEVEPEDDAA